MKLRNDFVSNSSSSSFIVMQTFDYPGDTVQDFAKWCKNMLLEDDDTLILPHQKIGNTQFGWEEVKYQDIGSKLNFASMQAMYAESGNYVEMLKNIVKDVLDINIKLNMQTLENYDCYIDHQSATSKEYPCNIEMFKSMEDLHTFLFKGSYIQGGNDNH